MEIHMEIHMGIHMGIHMDIHMEIHMETHMETHMEIHMELKVASRGASSRVPRGWLFLCMVCCPLRNPLPNFGAARFKGKEPHLVSGDQAHDLGSCTG